MRPQPFRLPPASYPAPELEGHIEAALRDDPRPAHDIAEIVRKDPAAVSYLQTCLFLKGFHAVQAQRVARTFWERGDFEGQAVAFAIQNRVSELWSVDVHPAARLGGGLLHLGHEGAVRRGRALRPGRLVWHICTLARLVQRVFFRTIEISICFIIHGHFVVNNL